MEKLAGYFHGVNYVQHNAQIGEHWDSIESIPACAEWKNGSDKF